MVRFFFVLILGFIFGAVVIENKPHFTDTVAIPVAFLPDGGQYDGPLLKGELSGLGRIVWPNGDVYEGEFEDGLFDGLGLYQTRSKIYEGPFVQGTATGQGKITYSNGNVYEGDVVNGLAEGQGKLLMQEGIYEGQFKDNVFHGLGTLIRGDGAQYVGEFAEGKFFGVGTYSSSDGSIYRGDFKEDILEGQGEYRNGLARYSGGFVNWLFHGEGEYQDETSHYIGEFKAGMYHGKGVLKKSNEERYEGQFVEGLYHGKGVHVSDGDRYEGDFEYGLRHGKGILTYAKVLDGIEMVSGEWKYDRLIVSDNSLEEYDNRVIVEDVLYRQQDRLHQLIDSIAEEDADRAEIYFVGIAGDGTQGVFRREVNYIRELFDTQYGTEDKSAVLINGRVSYQQDPLATTTSVEVLLQGVAGKMDTENDILFIYFSSHGSREFNFILEQPGLDLYPLTAQRMGEIIKSLPVKHKVVMISACFSGGYVQSVKDDNTMVIVAASEDRHSFGCSDRAEMTYFGEAFFKDSLPQSDSFEAAFELTRDIVRGREAKEGFENSNPLIFKPKAILERLAIWREDLKVWKRQQNKLDLDTIN